MTPGIWTPWHRLRGRATRFRTGLAHSLILAGIGGVAAWGHLHHWKLGAQTAHPEPVQRTVQKPVPVAVEPSSPELPSGVAAARVNSREARIEFESADTIHKAGIHLARVSQQPVVQYVTANASIAYDQTRLAQLATRVAGTVWRVEKRVGQRIQAGDILAIIEAVDVGQAKSAFLDAMSMLEFHRKTYERLKSIQTNVVSGRQVLQAEAELRKSEINLFNAQQTLTNLGLPVHWEDVSGLSPTELVKHMRFLGLPSSLVATLDPETTTANLIPLFAPFDGVVIGHDVVVGEAATPAHSQFVIADLSHMWIRLDVTQEHATQLQLGQEVAFEAEGLSHPIQSEISWISTEVDSKTRTVEVRADVDLSNAHSGDASLLAENQPLRANLFGEGRISIRSAPLALVAPQQAVQWDGQRHLVFVRVSDREFVARTVQPGMLGEGVVEICAGLAAGETVVTEGSHLLKSELQRVQLAGP